MIWKLFFLTAALLVTLERKDMGKKNSKALTRPGTSADNDDRFSYFELNGLPRRWDKVKNRQDTYDKRRKKYIPTKAYEANHPDKNAKSAVPSLIKVFVYGSLLKPNNQKFIWGSEKQGVKDVLESFDLAVHKESGILFLVPGEGEVDGEVYELTMAELTATDAYEGKHYTRQKAITQSGKHVLVYVKAKEEVKE